MPRRYDLELSLKQSDLFNRLSAKERAQVASLSREHCFKKGEVVFHEGRPSDSVWVTLEGRIHLLHHPSNGRIQATCVMAPGETFCCLPALDQGVYPATAVAATKARVLQIPHHLFQDMMKKSPGLLQQTLCFFSARLRQVETKGCMIHDPVERRIAQALLALRKKFGNSIPLTRQEIAELAGTTVETVIRTISRFQKQEWVRSGRGKVHLLQPDSLAQLFS
jgi:CRP-like cAMP-binding protein